ncbi:Glycosyltransferase, GT2 family [Lachnospiraceae bacterium]|nr:Glycosyltransferase, GT2 family [Lachnospiraceae bacterium]
MNTALIVLNYNDAERTSALVQSVACYRSVSHIVVVDNCSTDDSYNTLLPLAGEKIDVIRSESNAGYASGNNAGVLFALKHYAPEVLFIANPDVAFSEDTVIALYSTLMENKEYGVAAPVVRQGTNIWNLPGFIGIIESLFLVWFTLDKKLIRHNVLKDSRPIVPVDVVEGSFLAISADAWKKARGFDERTFLYAEEIIFAKRLRAQGFRECVLRDHFYDHLHSASIKKAHKSRKAAAFHYFRDSFRIYNRHYLHTSKTQDRIFDICWYLGYLERRLYDIVKSIR